MDGARGFDRLFPWLYAVLYVAVALAVQLLWFPVGDLGTESDFYGDFVIAAQQLRAGEFSVLNYPFKGPLYSFALVGVHEIVSLFGGDWYRAGVVLNLLCAAGVLVVLYRILRRAFGRGVAVCATVGVSLAFEFFLHAHKATSDLLFLLLVYLALERLTRRGWTPGRLAAAGVLGGLAFLTRYNGLIVPLAGAVVVLLVDRDRTAWRRRWLGVATLAAAFLVTVAPWYAANCAETGRLLATRNLQNIFVQEFYETDAGTVAPADRPDSLPELVRRDPLRVAGRYLANVRDHLRLDLNNCFQVFGIALLILGAARLLLFPPRRRHLAFYALPLLYFLAMSAVYYQPRFAFSAWPGWFALAFTALAGDGVDRPARFLSAPLDRLRARLPRWTGPVALAAGAALVFAFQIADIVTAERFYHARRPLLVLDTAPLLAHLAGDDTDAVVLARKPHLAHYAGLRYLEYPHELTDARDFLALAVAGGVRFIVVSDIERGHFPGNLFLGELDRYAGVVRVHQGETATIYELAADLDPDAAGVNEVTRDLERRLEEARRAGDGVLTFQLSLLAAEARARDGDLPAAAAHLEAGLAAMPPDDSPDARRAVANAKLNLAQTWYRLDRPRDGVDLLAPALLEIAELLPPGRQATAHFCLAGLQEKLGRLDLARRHFQQAHDLYLAAGDDRHAADMRRRLEALDQ